MRPTNVGQTVVREMYIIKNKKLIPQQRENRTK